MRTQDEEDDDEEDDTLEEAESDFPPDAVDILEATKDKSITFDSQDDMGRYKSKEERERAGPNLRRHVPWYANATLFGMLEWRESNSSK